MTTDMTWTMTHLPPLNTRPIGLINSLTPLVLITRMILNPLVLVVIMLNSLLPWTNCPLVTAMVLKTTREAIFGTGLLCVGQTLSSTSLLRSERSVVKLVVKLCAWAQRRGRKTLAIPCLVHSLPMERTSVPSLVGRRVQLLTRMTPLPPRRKLK